MRCATVSAPSPLGFACSPSHEIDRWTVIVIDDAARSVRRRSRYGIAFPEQASELRVARRRSDRRHSHLAPADPAQPDGGHAFLTHVPAQSVTTYSFKTRRR